MICKPWQEITIVLCDCFLQLFWDIWWNNGFVHAKGEHSLPRPLWVKPWHIYKHSQVHTCMYACIIIWHMLSCNNLIWCNYFLFLDNEKSTSTERFILVWFNSLFFFFWIMRNPPWQQDSSWLPSKLPNYFYCFAGSWIKRASWNWVYHICKCRSIYFKFSLAPYF